MNAIGVIRTFATLGVCLALAGLVPGAHAQTIEQLTDHNIDLAGPPTMPYDGLLVYAPSATNQTGTNPLHKFQIFEFDGVMGTAVMKSTFELGVTPIQADLTADQTLVITDDGVWLAFVSRSDPLGTNGNASTELFVSRPDGTGLAQLTDDGSPLAGSIKFMDFAGSGNRLAFVSNSDYTGGNPSNYSNLFVVEFSGTGLTQLTSAPAGRFAGLGISDDGTRIVFSFAGDLGDFDGDGSTDNPDGTFEIFSISYDGSGLDQLTYDDTYNSISPDISGDGSTITFQSSGNLTGQNNKHQEEIFVVDWGGLNMDKVTNSQSNITGVIPGAFSPTITDDGQVIFFYTNHSQSQDNTDGNFEIFKVNKDGSGFTQVTDTEFSDGCFFPDVSGDGSRVAFFSTHDFDGSSNLDNSLELFASDHDGSVVTQLTTGSVGQHSNPDMSTNAAKIVFSSNMNMFGTDPDLGGELYVMNGDGSGLAQLTTSITGNARTPSLSNDGVKCAFVSDANYDGSNADASPEVHVINTDGTGLTLVTQVDADVGHVIISPDGTKVFFSSTTDVPAGVSNADNSLELFSVLADGTNLTQLTDEADAAARNEWLRVDDAGTWAVFQSNGDLDLDGTMGDPEIWRMMADGTSKSKVFGAVGFTAVQPDISFDGSKIAFVSNADPLSLNPENNPEIFLYDVATAMVTQQLTSTTVGISSSPEFSGDGNWVFFSTSSDLFESDPDFPTYNGRINLTTFAIERIGGLDYGTPAPASPNSDGNIAVFSQGGNPILQNFDLQPEIFKVDHSVPVEEITVSGAAPTAISWDWRSGPLRYDVARGNVANLAPGVGGTVDLGPLVCIEDDSMNVDTVGDEDVADPLPGEAFFYLWRGTQGMNFGPGSYGTSSSNGERTPTGADCTG